MSDGKYRLLIVEDDKNAQDTWQRAVKEFNGSQKANIDVTIVSTRNEADAELSSNGFDFLIADLRLPTKKGEKENPENGNMLLVDVLKMTPICTAIFSAHPGEVSEAVNKDEERVCVFTKGKDTNHSVLGWLYSKRHLARAIGKTLHQVHGQVQALAARIFFDSILPRWAKNAGDENFQKKAETIIPRQIAAYISEELSLMEAGVKHHPEEFYLVPPIRKERLYTGDMLEIEGKVFVVLSPRCDMARSYPENVLIAECAPCTKLATVGSWKDQYVGIANEGKKKENLEDFVTHNRGQKIHFLPPCDGRGPWMVCFHKVLTRPSTEVADLLTRRFASIAPQFVPNLVQRFSSYLGRIGQPDLDIDEVHKNIQDIYSK